MIKIKPQSALFVLLMIQLTTVSATFIQCEFSIPISTWTPQKWFPISERETIVSTIYKTVDLIIDSTDQSVSKEVKYNGHWEPKNLRAITRFVKPGHQILNLGAHIGSEMVVLGKIVGPTGKVYVFEPFSVSHNIVLKNVLLNNLGWITEIYNVGCSNKYAVGDLAVYSENTGGSVIYYNEDMAEAPKKSQTVIVDLVDNVLPTDAILNFALIDVERLQVECLEGMRQTIKRSPDLVLMVEWMNASVNTPNISQRISALLDWFLQLKYRFYLLDPTPPKDCSLGRFNEYSKTQVEQIEFLSDVWFFPSHINPNQAQ